MSSRVGVDTGGTFTDLVALDESTGALQFVKRPSTPHAPGEAVLDVLSRLQVPLQQVALLVLGTTVGTNAVLQRSGARVIYLTTAGFEDIPYIQRIDKKDPYDLQWRKPQPFVARRDCLGVDERVTSDGTVLRPLTDCELERVAAAVERRLEGAVAGVAIAINLLFSYANPVHERALARCLRERLPGVPVSVSSDISPLWREYERASTTIIDAYLRPRLEAMIGGLERGLHERGFGGAVTVMKSNGGQMRAQAAKEQPAHTMLSGLSGGVIGGRHFAELAGCASVVTFDMGGTSTDVSLIVGGEIGYTTDYELDFSIPVSAPCVDLHTIGAGGGSIAWIDQGGMLRVGPHSAGAAPGPVCYGLGGEEVTVTDANLLLGRLDPAYFLGGYMELHADLALARLETLAARLGMTAEQTALAIITLANEHMANAIRVLTIERGVDPRELALVAFGGAGPLHGCEVAAALGIREVIVPPHPGLTSAFGALAADARVDRRWSRYYRSDDADVAAIDATLQRLTGEAAEELKGQGFAGTPRLLRSIGMRYAGQNYERDVPVAAGPITSHSLALLLNRFHESHRRSYGHHFPDETIEIIHFNVTALGQGARLALPELEPGAAPAPLAVRRACLGNPLSRIECPIYRRADLRAGTSIGGPAVIEEPDSTIFLLPDHRLTVTGAGICRITAPPSSATASSGSIGPGVESAPVDDITMSVIDHRLVNITREMGTAMMRTAYSPIFSESKDLSCAVFDAQGEMIAQGEFCPAQLGAIPHAVRWTIEELGLDSFAPGDVVVHNDPYRGGCHMPEHLMLKPVFDGGRLVMFVAVIGHVAEIGAKVIGSFASDATEVFQEGLRLPPVKLMRGGEYVREVWQIILANHRTPRNTWGDFHAMLGALNVGERRCRELLRRYGTERVLRATEQLIAYSERLMRAELRGIAGGEYTAQEQMEDDGIGDRPYTIRATVVVRDGRILVDYTGSDAQAQGPINATFGATASATYNAVLQLVGSHIPRNSGCYRPLEIIAPPGSVVNVRYPGPSVGGNTEGQPRIVGVILRALSRAVPERVMASEGATSCNFLFGGAHPRTGSAYAHYHFEASGWGGRWRTDGNSAQNHIHGNCRNTPVEIFETMFPFVVLRYGLNPDSGGAGARRGGLGTRRELRVTAPEITVSMMMDHVKEGAQGLAGGAAGGLGGIWVRRRGERDYRTFVDAFGVVSPSKFANVALADGDEIRIDSAGGGGYGDPRQRDPRLVVRDVAQGLISAAAAERRYGVRVTVDGHGGAELAGTVRGSARPGDRERGGRDGA